MYFLVLCQWSVLNPLDLHLLMFCENRLSFMVCAKVQLLPQEDESLNNCSSSGAGATAAAAAAGDGNSLQQVFAVATAKLFQTYDLDKSGSISRWELRPAIESMLGKLMWAWPAPAAT